MLATITGMSITVQCRDRAVHVEDTEHGDVCLLQFVPLAPGDDADEAVAPLSPTYAAERPTWWPR